MPRLSDILEEKKPIRLSDLETKPMRLSDVQPKETMRLSDIQARPIAEPAKQDDRGGLEKTMDVLLRPQYAVMTSLEETVKRAKDPEKGIIDFIGNVEKQGATALMPGYQVMSDLWEGLKGKSKKSFTDVLTAIGWEPKEGKVVKSEFLGAAKETGEKAKEIRKAFPMLIPGAELFPSIVAKPKEAVGIEPEKIAKGAVGLAGDILLDPTTYLGGEVTKAIGKGVGAIGKQAMKIPAVARAVEKTKPVLQATQKLFKNTTGIPELDDVVQKYTLEREYLKGKSMEFGIEVRKDLDKIAKATKQSVSDLSQDIVNVIEKPSLMVEAAPEIQKVAQKVKNKFSDILTREMKAGLPITEWSNVEKGIEYFPRITTKEAMQYLKQAKIGNSKVWNPKLANSLKRKTGDFTLAEFNDFARANGLESLGGNTVEEFFMKNPAYAVATRGVKSAKAITSKKFLDDTTRIFGKETKDAPKWYVEASESLQKQIPKLKGKSFDPMVANEMEKVYSKVFNPKEVGGFLKVFDNVQNYWKAWTLAPFPEYHVRNVVGNVWNNYLADVVDPRVYAKASGLQRYKKTGDIKFLKNMGIVKEQADEMIKQAEKLGVLGQGWFGSDIPQAVEVGLEKGTWNLLSREGKVVQQGMKFGTAIENNARLAHFIDKMGKGLSTDEAAKSVKKYLFDYGDLSVFERDVMKRLAPFYTWTRKNLPLQLEQVWKQPGKYLALEKMRRVSAEGEQPELKHLKNAAGWLYERYPMRIGKPKEGVVNYIPLEGWIPAADLVKLARAWEIPQEMLTPLMKVPIEQIVNKNLFFEQPIQIYEGETREFMRQDVPVRIEHILRQVRMLSLINRFIPEKQERKAKPSMKEQAIRSLTAFKIYPQDLNKLKSKSIWQIKKHVMELKKAYKWAKRNKREDEAKRIMTTIRETMKEL